MVVLNKVSTGGELILSKGRMFIFYMNTLFLKLWGFLVFLFCNCKQKIWKTHKSIKYKIKKPIMLPFWNNHDLIFGMIPFLYFFKHFLFLLIFKKYFIYLFLEIGEGREKERERNINVWLPLMCPYWRPGPQSRHVLLVGIEPVTRWLTGQCSIHWATPARAHFFFLKFIFFLVIICIKLCYFLCHLCFCITFNIITWAFPQMILQTWIF